MQENEVLYRIAALAIGYLFGLFQTGYFYAKSKGIDIHNVGSGNVGTTNTLRVLGKKAGLITFLGDLFKAMLAVWVVYLIFRNQVGSETEILRVLKLYGGLGAVLGHNFPCYLKFKGGKGIASTAGVVIAVAPEAAPICLFVFLLTVALTRYVSVGSISVVSCYLIQIVIFGQMGWFYHFTFAEKVEFYLLSFLFTAMAIIKHRANISRLMNGTENKLGAKKE